MGCQIPIERDTVTVFAPPTPLFASDSLICQYDSIGYFLQNSINSTTRIEWFFEGGFPNYDTLLNPTVYYPDTGSFDVQLILWEDGCSDTLTKTDFIQIKAPPVANFTMVYLDSCAPMQVAFNDTSTTNDGFVQSWQWNFGNGVNGNNSGYCN